MCTQTYTITCLRSPSTYPTGNWPTGQPLVNSSAAFGNGVGRCGTRNSDW